LSRLARRFGSSQMIFTYYFVTTKYFRVNRASA
jgi:hypothetical protein